MKTKTKFCTRESDSEAWDTIAEFDILIPNIDRQYPVNINGDYYKVRFVQTNIEHDMITQDVGLKKIKII